MPVQDIYMGLDYTDIVTGARLAQGSYVAVQISQNDKETWNWKEWVYDRNAGSIVNKETNKRIEHNYMIISISKYEES